MSSWLFRFEWGFDEAYWIWLQGKKGVRDQGLGVRDQVLVIQIKIQL
jgi:hypothetical protein